MDSKAPEENCNTETEEGTTTVQKKRSRRVSFAEITSIHYFDRDEEHETPPDGKPSSSSDNPSELGHNSTDDLGFHPDVTDSKEFSQNDEGGDDDMEEVDSFLRLAEFPSPGSTIGSATSNDEDNFFGPVSASFIRPGRLSDSAVSDNNHDVTMDSTAFSMHFRSLARSESGGELKTLTIDHLPFEEKTSNQDSIPSIVGSSMALTVAKKPSSRSSGPISKLGNGSDSNDMSLVGENPRRYDFGRLSPGLDALLAEGRKDLRSVSKDDDISIPKSPRNIEIMSSPSKSALVVLSDDRDKITNEISSHDMEVSTVREEIVGVHSGSETPPMIQITHGFSAYTSGAPVSDVVSPNHLSRSKEFMRDASKTRRPRLDFSAVTSGTLPNLSDNIHQLNVLVEEERRIPLAAFSSTKRRQVSSEGTSPSKSPWLMTPVKQTGSTVMNENNIAHDETASSIQKSISKLRMLEASPLPPILNAKIDNANLRSIDSIFKTPPVGGSSKGSPVKHMHDHGRITPLSILGATGRKEKQVRAINTSHYGIGTPKGFGDVSHTEEFISLAKGGQSPHPVSNGIVCTDQLPSGVTQSEELMQPNILTSQNSCEVTFVTFGTHSSLAEIPLDRAEENKVFGTPHKFVCSPKKMSELNSVAAPEYQGSPSRSVRQPQHVQYAELVSFAPGNEVSSGNLSKDMDDSLFMGRKAWPNSPSTEIDHSRELTELNASNDIELNHPDLLVKSGTMVNSPTALMDKPFPCLQSKIPDRNFENGRGLAGFKGDLPGADTTVAFTGSTSPFVHWIVDEPSLQKNLVEGFAQSPSRKELSNVPQNYNLRCLGVVEVPSPESNQLTNGFENSFGRKRRPEETMLHDRDRIDEIARNQRSPKIHKSRLVDAETLECLGENRNGTSTSGPESKKWADIHSKISGVTKELLSSSVDKLDLRAIDLLEDTLLHLQRSKTYEMMCTEIQSQKTFGHLGNLQHTRVAETRLLLHRFVHEQTKLQLMRVKRERLLKRVELLSSGSRQLQMLKVNYLKELFVDAQVDEGHPQHPGNMKEVACARATDEVTAMGQALEASKRKIVELTESFNNSCKLKGDRGCADTIVLVNDHLMKRTCCRFIRLDSQLWVVHNLENRSGRQNIDLNYLDFITQRLSVTTGSVSRLSISNKLIKSSIVKCLPDMDACTAFSFVLDAESTRKYVGPRSLAQETQICSSLLGNLLDVVEEVQLARIELHNLTHTSFCSASVQQLDLHLCFFNFKSGGKAAVTLDMSCLKWGIYPSDIIPAELAAPADRTLNSLSQPLFAEMRAAVQSLRTGYWRIIRLCRCISQVIQASSG